jgi:hypothetical protein
MWARQFPEGAARREIIFLCFTWFALTLALTAIVLGNAWDFWVLSRDGTRPVTGTVIAKYLGLHARTNVAVEYLVGSQRFVVKTSWVAPPNPPIADLVAGSLVQVFYRPEEPQRASIGNPSDLFKAVVGVQLFPLCVAPGMVVCTLWFVRRLKASRVASETPKNRSG